MEQQLIVSATTFLLASAGIALIGGVVCGYKQFKIYLDMKGYELAYKQFMEYSHVVVRALEQQGFLMGFSGQDKKRMAVVTLRKAADLFGLKVTDEVLDKIIEGAVQIINSEAGKFLKGSELEVDMNQIRGGAQE